ncbi:MAG: hypothetical protein ABI295_10840 [Xanthomarina sp.]
MEVKELIHSTAKKETLNPLLKQILNAYQELDYYKLNNFLKEGNYEDMSKTSFIYKQKRIFN